MKMKAKKKERIKRQYEREARICFFFLVRINVDVVLFCFFLFWIKAQKLTKELFLPFWQTAKQNNNWSALGLLAK